MPPPPLQVTCDGHVGIICLLEQLIDRRAHHSGRGHTHGSAHLCRAGQLTGRAAINAKADEWHLPLPRGVWEGQWALRHPDLLHKRWGTLVFLGAGTLT